MSTEASRVAFLGPKDQLQSYRAAALPAGVAVTPALLDAPEQYEEAFATVLRERADALLVGGSPVSYTQLRRTMKFAADNSLPAIYPYREAAEASGLIAWKQH
jgi:putative ABC transport system substrate-binding protein